MHFLDNLKKLEKKRMHGRIAPPLREISMTNPHLSVLLEEFLFYFQDRKIRSFVDCTLGAGGHAKALLSAHPEIEAFIGIDQDPVARELASLKLKEFGEKVRIVPGNFQNLPKIIQAEKISSVDGLLMDLGVSSMQLDTPEKGFSFMKEGPLDMRMDPEGPLTAAMVVNTFSQEELTQIFFKYGEEKQSKLAARVIVRAREQKLFQTTQDLVNLLYPVLAYKAKKGIHPLTLIFQALRLFVNQELEVLKKALPEALKLLSPKGRLAVISFHSLEDRIVKQFFQYEAQDKMDTSSYGGVFLPKDPTLQKVTKKPVTATDSEIEKNPRSRSAKLRVIEKI